MNDKFLRRMGIDVVDEDEERLEPSGYVIVSWLLFYLVAVGGLLYGALCLGAWLLRVLGVVVAGI